MALESVPDPCRYCQRTEGITTVGGMKRHENACKMNPASRSSGTNPDTVAIRVQKAASDAVAEARVEVAKARDAVAGLSPDDPYGTLRKHLDAALLAFAMHDKLAKLLEA